MKKLMGVFGLFFYFIAFELVVVHGCMGLWEKLNDVMGDVGAGFVTIPLGGLLVFAIGDSVTRLAWQLDKRGWL